MSEILGLSHLIFSSPGRMLQPGSAMEGLFLKPDFQSFDHFAAKKDLLRLKEREMTALTLYPSAEGDLPALELIPSRCGVLRPLTSYGLIFPQSFEEKFAAMPNFKLTARFAEALVFGGCHIAEEIPSLIATSPELERHSCTMGAWIQVSDLGAAKGFFADFAGAKTLEEDSDHAIFAVKVMNRKFSRFLIAVFKNGDLGQNFYNDDIGLAAFGWFAKAIPAVPGEIAGHYSISPEFRIRIREKKFKAVFFYDNRMQSNEIMVMDKD